MPDPIWHRTFLPDGPFECMNGCHDSPPRVAASKRFYDDSIQSVPQARKDPRIDLGAFPSMGSNRQPVVANPSPPNKPYSNHQRRYKAFKYTGTALTDIYIVGKIGQDFETYATEWERRFSILANGSEAIPVVDHSLTVIGHVVRSGHGTDVYVAGVQGLTNADGSAPTKELIYKAPLSELRKLLDEDYPMFVDDKRPPGPWFLFSQTLAPGYSYSIFTAPDGQVLIFFGFSYNASAEAEEAPWDHVMLLKDLVVLGARIGSKMIVYGARKAQAKIVQRIARGAERALAERAAAKVVSHEVGASKSFIPQSGMTQKHFASFQAAAQEEKLIVLVRNTNPKSAALIEHGAPGKPKNLEFLKTSQDDGIVSAVKPTEMYEVYDKGYAIVGKDKVARRLVKGDVRDGTAVFEVVEMKKIPGWQAKPGQVVEVQSKMPIVGDYDLMGVINPSSAGANVVQVAKDGKILTDFTNPVTQRFSRNVNKRMGNPDRVLHGAQDAYGGFRGGATGFFPDGTVRFFESEKEVMAYYESIKRQTKIGSYGAPIPPPADGVYPPLHSIPGGKK